jgi:hypothetical protein
MAADVGPAPLTVGPTSARHREDLRQQATRDSPGGAAAAWLCADARRVPGRRSSSNAATGTAAYTPVVIFFFGLGTKQQHLGPGDTRTCPRCHNTTQWTRMREFKQFTVFFVPVARWKRRQLEACGICGAAIEV